MPGTKNGAYLLGRLAPLIADPSLAGRRTSAESDDGARKKDSRKIFGP